jgi:glycosyltransferase involved in cell wall biosynthesis
MCQFYVKLPRAKSRHFSFIKEPPDPIINLYSLSMRVLMLSKACLVGAYQTKLELIGQSEDIELLAIVPPYWDDPAGRIDLERSHTEGYRLLADPIRFNGSYHLHYYPKLKQRLKEFQPHIVHIDEEPYNLATWLAWRQSNARGAKTLFFSWQNLLREYPIPFRNMEQQVLMGVDYAIMGNQDSAEVWLKKGYKGIYKVIPQFGVDPDFFHPATKRENSAGFIIGSANRRLVREKGVDLLLKAAAKLPGNWRVHIAGEGPEKETLQQLAQELGIQRQVFFDGAIASEQVPAYLCQMDVLTLCSRTTPNWKEQFGRVLVEAMSCEVPVIGSSCGEIPHVIDSAGMVFPEEDIDALHGYLLELMQLEEKRRSLGEQGRRRVLENYTQSQIAAQTIAIYREMSAS